MVHCAQILLSLRKNGQEESRLLNLRRLRSSRSPITLIEFLQGAAQTGVAILLQFLRFSGPFFFFFRAAK